MSVCVTGGKSVKLSLPECSKGTVNSGHDVCVFVCVPIVCVWSALISPCLLMRATGGLTPRPYRRSRLCRAESSLIVIIAVSLNRTQCINNPLPATSCSVIRNVRADLLWIFHHFSALLLERHTRQTAGVGIELATLLAVIWSQGIISSAGMTEWRPAKRWCKTTGIGPMTKCACNWKSVST